MALTEAQARAYERRRTLPRPERGDGLCQCGCGQPTKIAARTSGRDKVFRGYPLRFLHGHGLRGKTPGSYINGPGYRLVWMPDHPESHKQKGYVLEHRLVMEQTLGRPLTTAEGVHHMNHVKTDNRPENLELVDRVTHGRKHGRPKGIPMSPEHRAKVSANMTRVWAERRARG